MPTGLDDLWGPGRSPGSGIIVSVTREAEASASSRSPVPSMPAAEPKGHRSSAAREAKCDFRSAYLFAAGHAPSEALLGPTCSGTVAENTISAGNGPERESKFALCTRHSDLLWLLGYHGELRDGSSLHPSRSPAHAPGGVGPPVPPSEP